MILEIKCEGHVVMVSADEVPRIGEMLEFHDHDKLWKVRVIDVVRAIWFSDGVVTKYNMRGGNHGVVQIRCAIEKEMI